MLASVDTFYRVFFLEATRAKADLYLPGSRDTDSANVRPSNEQHLVIAPGGANAAAPQEGSSAGAAAIVHPLDCTVRELPVERDPNDLIRLCDRAVTAADFRLAALRARLQ